MTLENFEEALNVEHRLSRLETALMGDESMGVTGVVETVREVKEGQKSIQIEMRSLSVRMTKMLGWGMGSLTTLSLIHILMQVFK